jgi:aryl-alcohol dehydrogenase-like predicted oxidoreductase
MICSPAGLSGNSWSLAGAFEAGRNLGSGCGSRSTAAGMHQWTLDEDAAAPLFRQAVERGVTFWDTANVYQGGTSEEFVGRANTRSSPVS